MYPQADTTFLVVQFLSHIINFLDSTGVVGQEEYTPPPPQKKKKIGVIIAYNHWFSLKYYTPLFHSAIIGEWGSSEKKKNKTCILIYIMVSKGKNQTKSVIYSHETPQVLSVGVMLDIMFKESHYVGHSLALVGPRGSLSE